MMPILNVGEVNGKAMEKLVAHAIALWMVVELVCLNDCVSLCREG